MNYAAGIHSIDLLNSCKICFKSNCICGMKCKPYKTKQNFPSVKKIDPAFTISEFGEKIELGKPNFIFRSDPYKHDTPIQGWGIQINDITCPKFISPIPIPKNTIDMDLDVLKRVYDLQREELNDKIEKSKTVEPNWSWPDTITETISTIPDKAKIITIQCYSFRFPKSQIIDLYENKVINQEQKEKLISLMDIYHKCEIDLPESITIDLSKVVHTVVFIIGIKRYSFTTTDFWNFYRKDKKYEAYELHQVLNKKPSLLDHLLHWLTTFRERYDLV
jgi:hypothetical protein